MSDLRYIPTISPPNFLQQNRWTDRGNITHRWTWKLGTRPLNFISGNTYIGSSLQWGWARVEQRTAFCSRGEAVLQQWCSCDEAVLQLWYSSCAAVVPPCCSYEAAVMQLWCCCGAAVVQLWCSCDATVMPNQCRTVCNLSASIKQRIPLPGVGKRLVCSP